MKNFKRMHPLVSFCYYVGAISLMINLQHPIFLGAALLIIIAINFLEDRLKGLTHWLFFMITTGILIIVLNPIFNERGRHVLFEIFQHRITLEATVYGVMNALLIIGVMALFVSYNEVMSPNKLLYLFSKFLPQFAVLLMLTLRFIPLMKRRLAEISEIQTSKGLSMLHGRWMDKAKTGILYVQVLLVYSLEEAIQTADSMKARGYGHGKRTSYEYFIFKKRDLFALLYLLVVFLLVLIGRMKGYGYLTIYPVMESTLISPSEFFFLFLYLLFLSFPLVAGVGGYVRWRLSN
ncbi:energy-coupling factor transporter transmembrane component T [Neobacillus sp. PS3-12]|jgi:energy-coupling factor transport system permease protein|uniref:energy-coupling factor transporter transmembrane component T n=1 Tax=Neobacillus sp. PS3-12 TaxID=3070677 RepID=UPI0027E123A4|nr:energy-coupling factor transporter transmembrane component T [Neobacillus sp. PS3-12]WML52835.1 energy-coupling factor transporter transmembrane component T [Neobacillus sp. PS3-12]